MATSAAIYRGRRRVCTSWSAASLLQDLGAGNQLYDGRSAQNQSLEPPLLAETSKTSTSPRERNFRCLIWGAQKNTSRRQLSCAHEAVRYERRDVQNAAWIHPVAVQRLRRVRALNERDTERPQRRTRSTETAALCRARWSSRRRAEPHSLARLVGKGPHRHLRFSRRGPSLLVSSAAIDIDDVGEADLHDLRRLFFRTSELASSSMPGGTRRTNG